MSAPLPNSASRPASLIKSTSPLHHHLLNLPNFLTLCRIVSIPFFVALLSKNRFRDALFIFIAAALTDGLDGTLARWTNSRTELGAFLDPFADKLLLISAFVILTVEDIIPGWVLSVIVVRDVVVVFGYLMLVFWIDERIPVRPTYMGKAGTVLEIACIVTALLGWAHTPDKHLLWEGLLMLTVGAAGWSGLQYMYRGLVLLNSREPQMFE
ncbi:MAG: CDP-alcohol phosphatidyltransferase family protein [Candidatus Binataceae bacterium]